VPRDKDGKWYEDELDDEFDGGEIRLPGAIEREQADALRKLGELKKLESWKQLSTAMLGLDYNRFGVPKNKQEFVTKIEVNHPELFTADQQEGLSKLVKSYVEHMTRQPGTVPAFSEDEIMGFGKMRKGKNLPASIEKLNYNDLHNSQVWVMADWMGVRNAVVQNNSEASRRAELKKHCDGNLERAQAGYEVICLQKHRADVSDTPADKKALEMMAKTINGLEAGIDEHSELSVRKHAADVMSKLEGFAKKAILDASEKAKPLVIQSPDGKKRKIKGVIQAEFERMVQLASARIPMLLVGPAGCGKTYLAEKLGEALDLEVSDQSCSEGMSESVFNGLLLPIGANGSFKHVSSPFMDRYENGGVMLLDEMDAGDPNLFTYINKAIANQSYTVPQRYTKPVVKKHGDFVLIAAANTFGHGADSMYVGRNQLDAATLDRFKVGLICIDYSQDVELSLADEDLCTWAWGIRKKIRDARLRRVMSTRVIKDLSTMSQMYKWKQKEWEAAYFTGWSEADRKAVA
jgi:cobaltochelatase CobS